MDKTLEVTIFRTSDNRPMAMVHNFPGLDAEMTPEQLRAMAGALFAAASECKSQQLPKKGRQAAGKGRLSFDLSKKAV